MLRVNPPTGQELRDERDRRHMTQAEAAGAVGVSLRTWQMWEAAAEIVPQARHRRRLLEWFAGDEVAA